MIQKFIVSHQSFTKRIVQNSAAGSRDYVYAQFEFVTDDWDNLVITANFQNGGDVYSSLVTDGVCKVPWEVLSTPGFVEVSLTGLGDYKITTGIAKFFNDQSIDIGEESGTVEPTIFEKFVAEVKANADATKAMKEETEGLRYETSDIFETGKNLISNIYESGTIALEEIKESVLETKSEIDRQLEEIVPTIKETGNQAAEQAIQRILDATNNVEQNVNTLVDEKKKELSNVTSQSLLDITKRTNDKINESIRTIYSTTDDNLAYLRSYINNEKIEINKQASTATIAANQIKNLLNERFPNNGTSIKIGDLKLTEADIRSLLVLIRNK